MTDSAEEALPKSPMVLKSGQHNRAAGVAGLIGNRAGSALSSWGANLLILRR
jgi:hypothetical protein